MLSNAYARDSFKPSNVSKNWRMALFLFSQLALSSTIQGEGSTSSVSTKIANPAASLKKKETKKTTYSQEVANSKKGHSDTKSRGKLDIPGINHLSGSAHVGQTGLLQSLQRFTNQNQSHGDISKTAQQHGSYRLIEAQPVGVIEQVFLTEVPEEQIVLFPDNQLRFLGGVQDEFEDGFGLSELVQVDLGSGYGESGYDLSLEDGELIEQFEILPGYSGNDGVPIRNHGEYSNVELTKIEEKLDYLIQEVASGHKITPNTNYHFEKGTGKELNVLAIKVEELIKAVGGISKQNQVIDRQTSKTYSISAKTLNEVTSLNEKLEQLRHGISQISEEQQHTTERQNIAIVKSSKDITEINSRLTDLLRAVGRLGKDGSFQIESGYNNRGNNHNIEHESELREVRTSIRGLQSALESITSELNSVIGKITKITKNDNSITRLQNELSQVRSLLESSIEQNRTFGKKEIESISEVLQSQKTNFGNLSQKIARLAEALNSVTNEVRSGNTAEGEHSERIYREIKELGGRLKESYSSISSLIQKETSLISEYHLKESHEFSGKNVGVITSELNSLKDLIQKIASQQINLVQYTDTDNKNPKSQYAIITNLLLRIQKECEELVQGQQNILNKSQSGKIPNEFLRDIKGVTRAIMALKSVTERLFEEQAVLIKSKSPYGDDKWTAFNDKLVKVDKIFQSLTQQNLWLQQQSGLITKLDGNLVDFGKRIEYLVEEQRKLINFKGSKPGYNSINVDERQVVISVENLRTVVQNLVSSQKTLIEQYRNPSTPKELAKDIGSINYRLADISSIIDRLTKVQVELVNRYGKNHQDSDGDGSNKAIGFLSSQVNRLVEIVELIAKQQRSLIDGKAVNIDFNSLNGKFSGLNSRLGKLGERVSVIIKQQESIFDRLSNDQSEKYNDLRGILSQLRDSVIGLVNQENITIREGGNGKFSDKIQKEIDVLEELTTKIYQVIEKVAAEQQQILNNENGQSENIDQINGKITRLGSIMTLVLEQQKRLFSGGFKVPDYSKDIRKLNGQLIALKETTSRMIELQESSLKNAENSSLGDLNTLGKQLNLVRQAIEQLFSGQERVLEVVGKEETSQKILQNEGRLAQRVEQLTYLVQKLAEDQVRLLGNFKPGSGNAKGDLRGLVNRLGKLDEIIRILNTQQDYTIRLLDLVPVIREEGADIKKINGQMGTLRKLLHDLVALEKNDLAVDQETLEYVKGTAGRLSKVYEDIEKMFNGQKELLRYLQSSSSIRGIGEVREMSRKIYMLTEATRIVLNEVKSSLSQVEGSTKFIAQNTQQINAKINRLSSVINGVAEKQNILLKQITQLSQSQNKNFRVVNQRLNTLGKDINQLAYQQKQLLGKYGNDIEKIFGITDDKLSELRKTIEVMVNEQRKLVYFISEGNTIKSKEVLQELSKLDGGMNQLMKFVRGLLEQQNKLLAYTQEDNSMLKEHGEELRVFGEQFNKLYNLVTMVAETQKHLITREEVVNLFKQQNGNIKSLSLELAEISNQIVQLLNQQKAVLGNERGQNEELNQLRKVLSLVSESIRKVLVQQNVLLQGGWNKVPKELLNDINALRSQFMGLSKVVVQISDRQNYLIQQQNGDTKYIIEDIGQVKKNLSGLSQLVEKIAQFQLSIIKRGGLTPEQAQDLKYIKSELGNLDNKVAYLVEQQQKLVAIISKDGQMDNEKFARIVQNLAELRKTIYQLTSQQTSVLSQKFDEALRQKIPAEIAQLNGKLLGLNKDVDQVLGLQKELFVQSSKDTSLIVDRVGSLDARLEQLGAYVKELFLEQKTVLLNNSKLLEQNLIKTDLLTREVRNLDQKIQNLVRIQFDLLKRISADRTTDSKETTNILQRLSGLQSLISQLIEQQKKLLSISSTGRVPEPILRRLALLNEKYSQLVEIVNQLTSKQNTLVELSRDSNATGHQLEGQVSEVNKRLLGLFDFIKQTFAEQTKVLNTREITALLRDQNHRIAGLGVKLSELGNQFDKMINEQGLIIKQIGQASSEDSKRDRAIAVELGSLREVMRKLIESQRSLLGPEIAARVGEEVSKIISNLNDRMAQVGMVIRSVREEQTTIVKLLGEGGNYQKMEGRFAQLRQQFAQMAGWIKQMAVEQSKLLQRDEVMSILKEQTGDIRLIKSKLTQFKNDIIRIVEIQNVLLHETKAANQNDQARDTELAKRLGELRELTEGIVNIQQVVLNSDIYKIIPKETLLRVKEINARLEKLGPITFELLNQQKSLLELTSVEKRELDEIRGGVNGVSARVVQLLQEIKQIHGEQNVIISQNKQVKAALDKQLGYIQSINGRLTNFAVRTTEFLSQQAKLLEKVISTQERDENGLGETLNRIKELQRVVAGVLHWQQSLNLPEVIGSLPKILGDNIRELSEKIIHLTDNVVSLGQQQSVIVKKQDGEYESIRQGLITLNGRVIQFGDVIRDISSVQNKLIHDDRVLSLLNNQSNQIRGLGININTIRKEISQLISQQQQLLEQGSGIHRGETANLQKINGNISYLNKVVDQVFKQQQLLANSQLLNQFPKQVIMDVETLNGEIRRLGEFVSEVRNLQATLLKSQDRDNKVTNILVRDVEVLSGKFNGLSEYMRRILELQQAILNNEKVGPILEKFYGEFRGIDGRLSQLGELVNHILENQQSLVNTKEFQEFIRENNLNDKKIFETLSSLRNTIRVLVEQQKDLVRPEMLNAVARNLHQAIQAVGGRVTGLGEIIKRIEVEQNAVLKNQGQLNFNFNEKVSGLNQQLSVLNKSVAQMSAQQGEILRNEQVLKVIAERLNDLGPIKNNLSGVNERLNVLLKQQEGISQIAQKFFGEETEISKQIINRLTTFSQTVRQMISKQTTLLSERIVEKAPKELLGQIVGLNRQFEVIGLGLGKLFEIQKEILNHEHQEIPSDQILNGLKLLSQHFEDISKVAGYIAKKQDDLMNRQELLAILRQQSGAIHGVDIRVGQLGERVNSLIGQQRTLLGSIVQKLEKSGYSRDGFDAVLTRLTGLEKGIEFVVQEQLKLAELEVKQGNKLDGKIIASTQFLSEKVTRLTQVVDRLLKDQTALIAMEVENTKITKATFDGVAKLNNNLIHLDDAVQFLVKEAQQIDTKISTLLKLPQDMEQVKARLARLNESTKRLTMQHAQLFELTKEGFGTLNQQQHVLSKDMNIRLSEISKLVDQLTHQQAQLMAVESNNSRRHTQEIESLASKIYKIEKVVEFLLSEQRKLYDLNRREQSEQFAKLDQKLNLFGSVLKQLISQQNNVMRLIGLVEQQSVAVNNMGGAIGNLNGIVARLVSQQQQLLAYTKEHDRAELVELNGRLQELRNTVSNILNQHQVLLEREIRELRSQENRNDREITAHFDERINQMTSLMVQLVREQETLLGHIKRQTLDEAKIVQAISRISGQINELTQLTVHLNSEQNSLIERGFTHLSQQNNQGFKHMDDRLDTIGYALKRLAGEEANSLINRFELASQQQSRENREIKTQLNQISKVLEKIVTRPELIFPDHTKDFVDIRRRLGYLDQVMAKLTEIQREGTSRLLALDEEQQQKVNYLINVIPSLNESVRRLGMLGATDSHKFFEELSMIRVSMEECDKAILSLKETLNLNGFMMGSLVSPEINIENLIKKGVYSRNYALDRSGFRKSATPSNFGWRSRKVSSNYDTGRDRESYTRIRRNTYTDSRDFPERTSNDLHDGYNFHNGYWYPRNNNFNQVVSSARKYSSGENFSEDGFNNLSNDIDENLLQASRLVPNSALNQNDEEDFDSRY